MKQHLTALLVLALFSTAQAAEPEARDLRSLTEQGRQWATMIMDQVRGELVKELERTGPLRSILVCKYSAVEVTSRLSREHGARVTRVSLRPRNRSIGEPDAWEQKILMGFERKIHNGESADNMEHAEIVSEPAGRFFRYMRAIPMGSACLTCHGKHLSEGVRVQLRNEYPHDTAANQEVGELRGAVSVKKPL